MNVSFSGCGFLGIYHTGVASCLKTYAPYLLENKLCGSSAGAIAACCLICDVPLELMTSHMLDIVKEARSKTLGPFSPSMNISEQLYARLNKDLPDDVHNRVSGKLFVSLTRVPGGKNVIKSEFSSKEEVLQTLLASAFIPVFSGFIPPLIGKYRYMDGGFTDNLPILDKNTITISPFSGLTDICPRDNPIQKYLVNISNNSFEVTKSNCFRVARIMFPPEPEVLAKLCNQGFDDALNFLQKNNLINCKTCITKRLFTLTKNNTGDMAGYDPSCTDCKWNNAFAKVQGIPYSITYVLDKYIESHSGIFNGILKSKGMQLVKLFKLSCMVVSDIAYAFVMRVIRSYTQFQKSIWTLSKYAINCLLHFIDIFSEKGLELVSKVLFHSYMSFENHGKNSIYYYYYNEFLENVKSIKYSKNSLEYYNDNQQATSAIVIDSPGFTLNELNLHSHQVKSFRSKKHSIVHWTLSLTPEFVLKTSNKSIVDETVTSTKIDIVENLDDLKNNLWFDLIDDSLDKFIEGVTNHETLLLYHYTEYLNNASEGDVTKIFE
ncbi:patatin-like phospholipase domain-containing protein 5 isoform X2 [Sipha flava]|uniref:Patatin-like phospholipase domain-containing protein 5 isoform X2 n=2 Tax=Sipha flava TaxID=143950 RepID=A0A8B8FFH7_9HEMI|nr:patatin-like phospholipase domain-containing protein 5 isoform X2 [Sipha flava]